MKRAFTKKKEKNVFFYSKISKMNNFYQNYARIISLAFPNLDEFKVHYFILDFAKAEIL